MRFAKLPCAMHMAYEALSARSAPAALMILCTVPMLLSKPDA